MTIFANKFEEQAKKLKQDLAIKEIFGEDVVLTYTSDVRIEATPREQLMTRRFSMIPLWYLQFLADASPARIVDIGCGANFFKPVIKKIYNTVCHGIDPTPENHAADEFDFFDSDFSQGHLGVYESAFSINALHFIPLSNMTSRIKEFYDVISTGGRGFLALNIARMIDRSPPDWILQTFGSAEPTPTQLQDYVREQLYTLKIDFMVIDLLIDTHLDEGMDGNIRVVFKK
jgi:hypothetical protein